MVQWIAHRGASDDAPENTLAAVRLAWEQGADAVEVDVHLSADDEIIVIHDDTTTRTAGCDRPVCSQTLAELKALDAGRWKGECWADETIPTLAEVLEVLPDDKRLFIEIKYGPRIVPRLAAVLRQSGRRPEQIAVIDFSLLTLRVAKRLLDPVSLEWVQEPRAESADEPSWRLNAERCVQIAQQAGLTGLDLAATHAINKEFVEFVHRRGLTLGVWTVDDVALARHLIAAGVDGITTNRPGWLRRKVSQSTV